MTPNAAWHVYPLGFTGAPIRGFDPATSAAHRLGRLTAWLDYAQDLGIDALSLGPIFASQSHGYDTVDYYSVDPRLGDQSDFDTLIAAAHHRGIAVLLDGVFNHLGSAHPLAATAVAAGPGPDSLIRWSGEYPYLFEGHQGLITLNHASDQVAGLVGDVMRHWMARGADGWRLDAAYAVPGEFWARVLPGVRAAFPQAYIFGEVIHGDYPGFVATSGADSVTQYELWKAVWSSLLEVNFFELSWTLGRHNAWLEGFRPVTFVSNHDVTRIASQVGPQRAALAAVILFTVGGSPHVYAGDEQGFIGTKEERPDGDDAVRPAFPDTPAGLWPGGWEIHGLYQRLIALRRAHPWLAWARTENLTLTTDHYVYKVADPGTPGASLTVDLDLSASNSARARITDQTGAELFTYPA
jgi:glycosidase